MPQKPTRSAKNETGDFGKFKQFATQVMAVPHSKIKAALDAEKQAKKQKSSRVSTASCNED